MSPVQARSRSSHPSIGLDLVKRYSKQGWDIIAAVRDPATMPSVERVKVVKIVSDSETDAHDVSDSHGVPHFPVRTC